MDIILECLSDTWLIITCFLIFIAVAKYDQKKQERKWDKDVLTLKNGGVSHG